jgi:hypothetical protein
MVSHFQWSLFPVSINVGGVIATFVVNCGTTRLPINWYT